MPALVKAEKGLDCPSGKVLVSVLGSGEDSVDVDLFVVPWRGPGRPMGLNKGWKGQDNRGLKVTKLSGSCDPRVVDYFRPFGGKTVSKDDAPPGLKKPPWQIKTERLAEDQERERKEQNRAIKEGRPVQRPRCHAQERRQMPAEDAENGYANGVPDHHKRHRYWRSGTKSDYVEEEGYGHHRSMRRPAQHQHLHRDFGNREHRDHCQSFGDGWDPKSSRYGDGTARRSSHKSCHGDQSARSTSESKSIYISPARMTLMTEANGREPIKEPDRGNHHEHSNQQSCRFDSQHQMSGKGRHGQYPATKHQYGNHRGRGRFERRPSDAGSGRYPQHSAQHNEQRGRIMQRSGIEYRTGGGRGHQNDRGNRARGQKQGPYQGQRGRGGRHSHGDESEIRTIHDHRNSSQYKSDIVYSTIAQKNEGCKDISGGARGKTIDRSGDYDNCRVGESSHTQRGRSGENYSSIVLSSEDVDSNLENGHQSRGVHGEMDKQRDLQSNGLGHQAVKSSPSCFSQYFHEDDEFGADGFTPASSVSERPKTAPALSGRNVGFDGSSGKYVRQMVERDEPSHEGNRTRLFRKSPQNTKRSMDERQEQVKGWSEYDTDDTGTGFMTGEKHEMEVEHNAQVFVAGATQNGKKHSFGRDSDGPRSDSIDEQGCGSPLDMYHETTHDHRNRCQLNASEVYRRGDRGSFSSHDHGHFSTDRSMESTEIPSDRSRTLRGIPKRQIGLEHKDCEEYKASYGGRDIQEVNGARDIGRRSIARPLMENQSLRDIRTGNESLQEFHPGSDMVELSSQSKSGTHEDHSPAEHANKGDLQIADAELASPDRREFSSTKPNQLANGHEPEGSEPHSSEISSEQARRRQNGPRKLIVKALLQCAYQNDPVQDSRTVDSSASGGQEKQSTSVSLSTIVSPKHSENRTPKATRNAGRRTRIQKPLELSEANSIPVAPRRSSRAS